MPCERARGARAPGPSPDLVRAGALAGALLLAAGAPPLPARADGEAWRKHAVALQARGFRFRGLREEAASWDGAGAWIRPGVLATTAQLATRALEIAGTDGQGRRFAFSHILLLDAGADLALLAADPGEGGPTPLVERPARPGGLRGSAVEAVWATGGGLVSARGTVVGSTDAPGELLIHGARAAGPGPLFAADGRLLGLTTAVSGPLRRAVALPAWRLARAAAAEPGLALAELFARDAADLPLVDALPSDPQVCLEKGGQATVVLPVQGPLDLVLEVRTDLPGAPLAVALRDGADGPALASGEAQGEVLLRSSVERGLAALTVELAIPEASEQARLCATVGPRVVDWARRLDRTAGAEARGTDPVLWASPLRPSRDRLARRTTSVRAVLGVGPMPELVQEAEVARTSLTAAATRRLFAAAGVTAAPGLGEASANLQRSLRAGLLVGLLAAAPDADTARRIGAAASRAATPPLLLPPGVLLRLRAVLAEAAQGRADLASAMAAARASSEGPEATARASARFSAGVFAGLAGARVATGAGSAALALWGRVSADALERGTAASADADLGVLVRALAAALLPDPVNPATGYAAFEALSRAAY